MLLNAQFSRSARFSLFLILVWAFIFPAKGALYQIALYLLPFSVFLIRDFRTHLPEYRNFLLMATLLLVVPYILTDLWTWFDAGHIPDKDGFDVLWRMVLFPVCLVIVLRHFAVPYSTLIKLLILMLLFYGLYVLGEFVIDLFEEGKRQKRFKGLVFNENPFGMLMALGSLLSMFQFTQAQKASWRIGYFALAWLFVFLVLLSGSRSSLLSLVIALVLMLFLLKGHYRFGRSTYLIVIGVVLLFSLFLFFNPEYLRYWTRKVLSFFSDNIRLEIWQHFLAQLEDKLLLGGPLSREDRYVVGNQAFGPHSTYIEIIRRTGVIGLVGFVLFIIQMLWVLWRNQTTEARLALSMLVFLLIFVGFNAPLRGNSISQSVFAMILVMFFYALHDGPSRQRLWPDSWFLRRPAAKDSS